jgi:hypothetical protein
MTQEDLKDEWEGVLSIEGNEIVAITCWMKIDLKFYFFQISVGIQKKLENKFCCNSFGF